MRRAAARVDIDSIRLVNRISALHSTKRINRSTVVEDAPFAQSTATCRPDKSPLIVSRKVVGVLHHRIDRTFQHAAQLFMGHFGMDSKSSIRVFDFASVSSGSL